MAQLICPGYGMLGAKRPRDREVRSCASETSTSFQSGRAREFSVDLSLSEQFLSSFRFPELSQFI
jgi:hypothetical protein